MKSSAASSEPTSPATYDFVSSDSDINSDDEDLKDNRAGDQKRLRTSPEQLQLLERVFTENDLPSYEMREELASQLGMSPRRIQVWFQNKRAKLKRERRSLYSNYEGYVPTRYSFHQVTSPGGPKKRSHARDRKHKGPIGFQLMDPSQLKSAPDLLTPLSRAPPTKANSEPNLSFTLPPRIIDDGLRGIPSSGLAGGKAESSSLSPSHNQMQISDLDNPMDESEPMNTREDGPSLVITPASHLPPLSRITSQLSRRSEPQILPSVQQLLLSSRARAYTAPTTQPAATTGTAQPPPKQPPSTSPFVDMPMPTNFAPYRHDPIRKLTQNFEGLATTSTAVHYG